MQVSANRACSFFAERRLSYPKTMQVSANRACSFFAERRLSYPKTMQVSANRACSFFAGRSLYCINSARNDGMDIYDIRVFL